MTYRIEVKPAARRAMKGLPRQVLERIDVAILGLATEPRPSGSIKMTNCEAWRVRVGDYRIVYEIHDAVLVVFIIDVGHRREVYR